VGDDVATDNGRATMDWVQFDVEIDPNNVGVDLIRRLDYSIADQRGDVYVDNVFAGEWYTPGQAGGYFLDHTFTISGALTTGKSSITVRIEFVSSAIDWNEFHYWVDTLVMGVPFRTDELDVGNTADETAHNYTIFNPTWEGWRTFPLYHPPDPVFTEILRNARLVATWDGALTPQVDVPLGRLFASSIGPTRVKGLPVGVGNERMYCWLPMPFASSALVRLINDSAEVVVDLQYRVRYTPHESDFLDGLGHLYATYNEELPCTVGRDYTILEETGAGHFIGVVQTDTGPTLSYLEGDERIHVDGSLTPALYGTATEDFCNGGWYFNRGRFSRPVHGNPAMEGSPVATDVYRFLLSDLIPFTTGIKVGIEHGGSNQTPDTDIRSVALYYKRPEPLAAITDELDVGDAASEAAHAYAISGETWSGSLTDEYEGDDDDVSVTDDGRGHNDRSEFTVAIEPCNAGVLLRRRMDYALARQQAEVYVDDEPAGVWYDAGENGTLWPTRVVTGDVDGDADVDLGDLALLLSAYGTCEGDPDYNAAADFDDDGCITLSDLALLLSNYGYGPW